MKTQHSLGPWAISENHGNWDIVTDKKGNVVANVNHESGPDLPPLVSTKMPAHNNARLIAAAPELLEACKGAFETAEDLGEDSGIEITKEAFGWIKDAIAKANGQ